MMAMYTLSGGKTDLSMSIGFANINFSRGEFGTFSRSNAWYENFGYGLGAFGNLVDVLGAINPPNSMHTLETDNTDLNNGFDPGHSQFRSQNGELSISFGPDDQYVSDIRKFLGTKGTNNYQSKHGLTINSQLNKVGLSSKVVNTINRITNKTPYSAAFGIQCTGATTLTALLSGHFMPNIALLTFNAPQLAHYTLLYEQQIRAISALSSIYLTR